MKKLMDGVLVDLTTEEQADYEARQAAHSMAVVPRLLAALAAHRYSVEVSGTSINGITLATDRESSQPKWIAERIKAKEDAAYTRRWKAVNGWVTLNAEQIIAAADAVHAHVGACFDAEGLVSDNIGNYTTEAQVRAAFNTAFASM